MVKDEIPVGIYPNPLSGRAIQPRLLIVNLESKYGLIGDAITITLFAYIDALGCKFAIITVDMS